MTSFQSYLDVEGLDAQTTRMNLGISHFGAKAMYKGGGQQKSRVVGRCRISFLRASGAKAQYHAGTRPNGSKYLYSTYIGPKVRT